MIADRDLASKRLALEDLKKSYATETSSSVVSNVDEIRQEISVCFMKLLHFFYLHLILHNLQFALKYLMEILA